MGLGARSLPHYWHISVATRRTPSANCDDILQRGGVHRLSIEHGQGAIAERRIGCYSAAMIHGLFRSLGLSLLLWPAFVDTIFANACSNSAPVSSTPSFRAVSMNSADCSAW